MPVLEREHAQRAGLGWIGKHTLLIHPELGSYTTLGGSRRRLTWKGDGDGAALRCDGSLRRLHAAHRCVPDERVTPYSVDATSVSYLTIEHEERHRSVLHEGIGDWLIGCDVCQEVCPHNHRHVGPDRGGQRVNRRYLSGAASKTALICWNFSWTEADRSSRLTSSAIKRFAPHAEAERGDRGNRLVRAEDVPLEARVRSRRDEAEDELVRQTARDVVDRSAAEGLLVVLNELLEAGVGERVLEHLLDDAHGDGGTSAPASGTTMCLGWRISRRGVCGKPS